MSQEKKKFQDPALFTNPVRMPWGETLEGPPCLPQDHGSGPQVVYEDAKRTESGPAVPLSCAQQTELSTLLQIVRTTGASSLSEARRKRLQWLLSRPESTTETTMILTKKGRVTFT